MAKKKHEYDCKTCNRTKKCHIEGCNEECPKICGRCLRDQRNNQNIRRRLK